MGHEYAVLVSRPCTEEASIGTDNLRGVFADRALKFSDGGHIANPSFFDANDAEHGKEDKGSIDTPEYFDEFLSHRGCKTSLTA